MSRATKIQRAATDGDWMRGQKEAAAYKRVSPRTISEWQRRGIIPYTKIGKKCVLFSKSKMDAALARFEIAAIG